jgi:hypothetical protein
MLEITAPRKNKINLSDYPMAQDIECRLVMGDFCLLDIEVLEEILYSPLKISFKKLLRNLSCAEEELSTSLKKLTSLSLLTLSDDTIFVDKERRKVFEFEMTRFQSDFKPDMEFLQGLLRKVPIHVLPAWYSIPRTSNNIFESIVEKYLFTPHLFQRYIEELQLADSTLNAIIRDVYDAPNFKVASSDLIAKHNLTARAFEEMILVLEFNFACCLSYEKEGDHLLEYVTPFHEWREYLCFLRATEPVCIEASSVEPKSDSDFAFIEEMSDLLLKSKGAPQAIEKTAAVEKLCLLKLAEYREGHLITSEAGDAWLDLSLENKALHLYRHPQNRILSLNAGERCVREAEKSIKRVLHGGWVYFDDFIQGVQVPLSEQSVVMLKRFGKHWKYTLPVYGNEEKNLIKAVIFEWLYEFGIVTIGKCQGKDCFAVTPFGRFFFED